ncbi:hypothetical protein H8959_004949 [Pygathrix nigripes]
MEANPGPVRARRGRRKPGSRPHHEQDWVGSHSRGWAGRSLLCLRVVAVAVLGRRRLGLLVRSPRRGSDTRSLRCLPPAPAPGDGLPRRRLRGRTAAQGLPRLPPRCCVHSVSEDAASGGAATPPSALGAPERLADSGRRELARGLNGRGRREKHKPTPAVPLPPPQLSRRGSAPSPLPERSSRGNRTPTLNDHFLNPSGLILRKARIPLCADRFFLACEEQIILASRGTQHRKCRNVPD